MLEPHAGQEQVADQVDRVTVHGGPWTSMCRDLIIGIVHVTSFLCIGPLLPMVNTAMGYTRDGDVIRTGTRCSRDRATSARPQWQR